MKRLRAPETQEVMFSRVFIHVLLDAGLGGRAECGTVGTDVRVVCSLVDGVVIGNGGAL